MFYLGMIVSKNSGFVLALFGRVIFIVSSEEVLIAIWTGTALIFDKQNLGFLMSFIDVCGKFGTSIGMIIEPEIESSYGISLALMIPVFLCIFTLIICFMIKNISKKALPPKVRINFKDFNWRFYSVVLSTFATLTST